jgi:hypothetical protein
MLKSMLLNKFLFRFWGEVDYFWTAFDMRLQSFFKPQKVIFVVFGVFLAITVLYSIINFIIVKKMSIQTSNLVVILYELNKEDVASYLDQIQKFQIMLGHYDSSSGHGEDDNLDLSSDEEPNPKFDRLIQSQSNELKTKHGQKSQIICELIRFVEPGKLGAEFQQKGKDRSRWTAADDCLYFGLRGLCHISIDRLCKQLGHSQLAL